MDKQQIAVFDFDGTITYKDSFLLFLRFCFPAWRFCLGMLICLPVVIGWKCRLITADEAKQAIFCHFYKKTPLNVFNDWCVNFSTCLDQTIRPEALEEIRKYQESCIPVIILSASIENWIIPWAEKQGIRTVLATRIKTDHQSRLTGRFAGRNCKGFEKVRRLKSFYPDRSAYYFISYGDSKDDLELLRFSDKGIYKPFTKKSKDFF